MIQSKDHELIKTTGRTNLLIHLRRCEDQLL